MIFELVGSRVLAPFFGTSLFVWTSLIGLILGCLSLGYYLGGNIADKKASKYGLAIIIFLAGIFIGSTVITKDLILVFTQLNFSDIRLGVIVSSLLIFSPPSVLLGMVSPYVAKLKLDNISNTGATVGSLYAISTGGSILGTFFAGFYLIPFLGTNKLIVVLAIVLVILSIMILIDRGIQDIQLIVLFMLFPSFFLVSNFNIVSAGGDVVEVDTKYSRVFVYDQKQKDSDKMIRKMQINMEASSAMYLNSDELVYDYCKFYDLVTYFHPEFKKTLILGGAGYSYPKHFLEKYEDATIDVVEIDPGVTQLAREHFRLKSDSRMDIIHQDGRVFLNRTDNKYDVIFGDAFGSKQSVPYQLTTKEAVQKQYDILNEEGVVFLNLISSIKGSKGEFLRAEYWTFKSVFPQVYIFPVQNKNGYDVQNIILVALKSDDKPDFTSDKEDFSELLEHRWDKDIKEDKPILTDDKAPVNYYTNKAFMLDYSRQ